jgi:hypothetical protein
VFSHQAVKADQPFAQSRHSFAPQNTDRFSHRGVRA